MDLAAADARRNVVTLTERRTAERVRIPLVVEVQRELTTNLADDEKATLLRRLGWMLKR